GLADFTTVNQKGKLQVNAGGTATNVTLKQGGALVTSTAATVTGSNRLGNFTVENGKADGVVLESGGRLDVLEGHSAQKTRVDDGGTLAVSAGGKATGVTMTSGGALIADSGATVEGTNASGKFSIDGISGQASGLLLENGGSFTVNAGGQAGNTTVGHRGTLTLAAGGSLSGRTQLSKGASMVLNGDVVSTGDIVNAGEIRFDNQTTQDAVLSRAVAKGDAPVTFHKLTTSTAAAGSNMTFSPSRNGTSLDLQAGLKARVRENITLGVQAGYAHSVSGNSAEGYNGQATLNVTF
ncbi:AIDA repeat-containing protein, partial [Escherichia sp. WS522]|uniref:AIDA repeat-containing protein n=1 Tax=Escherichia sp. WS522 TaxID=3382000 RepID=UPI00396CAD41